MQTVKKTHALSVHKPIIGLRNLATCSMHANDGIRKWFNVTESHAYGP